VFDLGKAVKIYAHDGAAYINDDWDITELIRVSGGLRYSYFQHTGPFDRYVKDDFGTIIDTIFYKRFDNIADYSHIEPRLSARFTINENSSIKAGYTQNYQYIHLASISSVSLPTDIWFPSTSEIKPEFATQYALGYFQNFKKNTYETSVEVYYKTMDNLIEYKDGYQPDDGVKDNPDAGFVSGSGEAYGAEFFVKKKYGSFTGWIGYTLAWTNRTFADLNNGNMFPAKYDRRHDLSIVTTYELNKKWTFSAIFIYATGNAATVPIGRYFVEGWLVSDYGDRNSYRLPAYHRADISATLTPDRKKQLEKKRKRMEKRFTRKGKDLSTIVLPRKFFADYETSWNFSIFNVYNRHNPYYIYFDAEGGNQLGGTLTVKAYQVSLFPILPSVTWNFKF
jgi:hypothetical protein